MQRRKAYKPPKSKLDIQTSFMIGNREVSAGERVKVYGVHGVKFQIIGLVTHENGTQWVDCYELSKGVPAQTRAFYLERIKLLPRKRRKKMV